jgi:RNA polymerase sigma-70 factor, ECF subfamily
MKLAGASTLGNVASALGVHNEENSVVAELKAGSEDAFSWLIAHYHQPVYSLVYRMVNDPADAADTVQEVFIKVFRGIKRFNGQSSLKTWIYRIAVHEASNRRRWWFRHKGKEVTIEAEASEQDETPGLGYKDTLEDRAESPFENAMHEQVRAKVETELAQLNEPYRTTVVLRDIEDLSYEEIAEITGVSLGTVKSRLMRGRQALKKRLEQYVKQHGAELGLSADAAKKAAAPERAQKARATEVSR